MVFNSLSFALFFAVVLALYQFPFTWEARKNMLLVASSVFYAAWHPMFLALLWVSILTDWWVAQAMARTDPPRRRRGLLMVSLVVNLGMLAFFKYGNFILANTQAALDVVRPGTVLPHLALLLPVGISFYTFETLSYTVDVFRRAERPWRSFRDFALFLTFFPHLVAGPIVRPSDFLPQCETPRFTARRELTWGLTLIVFGLCEKMVLADGFMAPVVTTVFREGAPIGFRSAWTGALAFSAQIFFDFAGYSLCAVGAALCFGFRLPDNFEAPYGSIGFSEFWRRWHISLSSWLRDYLYISLGGNRGGAWATQRNLVITMLLGGLWHGASWNFVVWGGLHGLYLVGERMVRTRVPRMLEPTSAVGRGVALLVTYVLVVVAWVFFRATDFPTAWRMLTAMAGAGAPDAIQFPSRWDPLLVVLVNAALLLCHRRFRDVSFIDLAEHLPGFLRVLVLAVLLVGLVTLSGDASAFIYFQF